MIDEKKLGDKQSEVETQPGTDLRDSGVPDSAKAFSVKHIIKYKERGVSFSIPSFRFCQKRQWTIV